MEKMEAASQPAFASEIITCEGLIAFFDPESAEAARKAKLAAAPQEFAAKPTREVDATPLKGKKFERVEEDFFVGTGGKKKKGKKTKAASSDAQEAAPSKEQGIKLDIGLLQELSKVDVEAPSSQADVPKTLEVLRTKLAHYKDIQEKTTKEV